MVIGLVAVALFFLAFFGYLVGIYNALVRLKNDISKSWANIDVLLKQRADELPKLIASVKGYMKHEKQTLENLTLARTSFLSAKTMGEKAKADSQISGILKSIFAVAENYPNLKASENFLELQKRISAIENELADRREFYNESVNNYNIKIHSFPDMLVAGMLQYRDEEMFKASEEDRKDVKVEF
ncbi:MAG: LemA family protein [Nanoarchaeota archaeon]|nr:LemA family protein [Nanoarchaeota archaeon]